jgi:hypothetical protein
MSGHHLTEAEIDAALGTFDGIFRAVAAGRRGDAEANALPFDSYIVDTALSLSRQVRVGDLDQAACDQMIWGLILARGLDQDRLEAGLARVETRLHEQLRTFQRVACELTEAPCEPVPRPAPMRPAPRRAGHPRAGRRRH